MCNEFDKVSIENLVYSEIESALAMLMELLSLLEDRVEDLYLCSPVASVQETRRLTSLLISRAKN